MYEVVKYVRMTNHMWSGFNLLAHLPTWNRVPDDIKAVIERNAASTCGCSGRIREAMNAKSRTSLAGLGLSFNDVESAAFRKKLSGVYATWRASSVQCWALLEARELSSRGRERRFERGQSAAPAASLSRPTAHLDLRARPAASRPQPAISSSTAQTAAVSSVPRPEASAAA